MNKKTLMKFLRTSKVLSKVDNVVYAEKAFVINQVMNYVLVSKLSETEVIKVLTLVNKYVHNELTLSFKNNNLAVEFFDEEKEIDDDILASSL
jgi:hypothetical protein|tara:strand:- start:81 stop:359 length:279 start_codon:yes stop_codon:yes gene_type:complete